MIYSRFGGEVTIVRLATVADVKKFEGRKPDKEDRRRTKERCRVVCIYLPDGKEFLADVAYLKADKGFAEIDSAIEALP